MELAVEGSADYVLRYEANPQPWSQLLLRKGLEPISDFAEHFGAFQTAIIMWKYFQRPVGMERLER